MMPSQSRPIGKRVVDVPADDGRLADDKIFVHQGWYVAVRVERQIFHAFLVAGAQIKMLSLVPMLIHPWRRLAESSIVKAWLRQRSNTALLSGSSVDS
jgi:hypothetical protein